MPRTTPYAPKQTYDIDGPNGTITLTTYTKSEARSLAKKKLGLRPKGRLPIGIQIKRIQS